MAFPPFQYSQHSFGTHVICIVVEVGALPVVLAVGHAFLLALDGVKEVAQVMLVVGLPMPTLHEAI